MPEIPLLFFAGILGCCREILSPKDGAILSVFPDGCASGSEQIFRKGVFAGRRAVFPGKEATHMRYLSYSEYMKRRYGRKVYKLPVSLTVSCPNRLDGRGCTFCGAAGAGFENLSAALSVTEQLRANMEYIGKRYGAGKLCAYFQNFTNTFLPVEDLSDCLREALTIPEIAEVCISTRPDCISNRYLDAVAKICGDFEKPAVIELGLQSIRHKTLKKINRGHSLAEFIDGVLRCHSRGFEVCAHLILNLPWDDGEDAEEAAKILTSLKVEQVKLHSLYIERDTELCRQYEDGEFRLIGPREYAERVRPFSPLSLSRDLCAAAGQPGAGGEYRLLQLGHELVEDT